jgi:hypothetical protein
MSEIQEQLGQMCHGTENELIIQLEMDAYIGSGMKCSSHTIGADIHRARLAPPVECEQGIPNLPVRMLAFITSTKGESSKEAEPKSERAGKSMPRLKGVRLCCRCRSNQNHLQKPTSHSHFAQLPTSL